MDLLGKIPIWVTLPFWDSFFMRPKQLCNVFLRLGSWILQFSWLFPLESNNFSIQPRACSLIGTKSVTRNCCFSSEWSQGQNLQIATLSYLGSAFSRIDLTILFIWVFANCSLSEKPITKIRSIPAFRGNSSCDPVSCSFIWNGIIVSSSIFVKWFKITHDCCMNCVWLKN